MLFNLVNNAMKFTYEGHVRITVEPDGLKSIRIAVSDTGIGMSSKKLRQQLLIIEEEITIRPSDNGLGLGLPICNKLAR